MKRIIKIFIILSMIFGFWIIIPLVMGIIILKKLDEIKNPEELKIWGILTIFTVSVISGILMLFVTEKDLNEENETYKTHKNTTEEKTNVDSSTEEYKIRPAKTMDEVMDKLSKYKYLQEQGVINESEFEKIKQRELDAFFASQDNETTSD